MNIREKERILRLVPAIRILLSSRALKSGRFLPLERLTEQDPEKIALRLGQGIPVFSGSDEEILKQVGEKAGQIGDCLFIAGLGLLGLSVNQSELEERLAELDLEGRGSALIASQPLPRTQTPLCNKVVAITGGAMGYGEGIARELFSEGVNLLLMDINREAGEAVVAELNAQGSPNRASFVYADVGDADSVADAVFEAVLAFSGLDVMISNAGVLKAGGIEDLRPEDFELITRVNYTGYYNCVRAVVPVMKAQNSVDPANFGDIIQINSKSGIEGSRKNFAYAGSKFGGMGLTHSLALELMPERIKVNAICPGNYFEGPLWSDPEKGLFVQYLHSGKVPGAKTVEDVKRAYEAKVPAGRGCRIGDVVKAIRYVIDQEYETGQAIPVTGGQVMLS